MKKLINLCAATAILVTACTEKKTELAKSGQENMKGVNIAAMDTSVVPCEDFWHYANGAWLEANPVPGSETRWGSFNIVQKRNNKILKQIFVEADVANMGKGSNIQKIGDYYHSAMDSTLQNEAGITPALPYLEKIDACKSMSELQAYANELETIGIYGAIGVYIGQDSKDSEKNSVHVAGGGMGLPDRDYYLNEDQRYVEYREGYVAHMTNMFKFTGMSDDAATASAKSVLGLETKIAGAQMSRVERRDPQKRYNKRSMDQLREICGAVNWDNMFAFMGITPDSVIIGDLKYFDMVNESWTDANLAHWKNYYKWMFLDGVSNKLGDEIAEESFNFFSRTLRGQKERKPRWKRALAATNGALGELVGQEYVKITFKEETKQRLNVMVDNLMAAFKERLSGIKWMSDVTRAKALEKLATFNRKLAYPDKWKDYSALDVERGSYLKNSFAASHFEHNEMIAKFGKPVDHDEWGMSPQTVNAYYHPLLNEVVFPAAILQPPFLNPEADDAVLYGTMGAVIGHEFTHGFDDSGSQFDAHGKMHDWWTPEDREKFEKKANVIVDQFGNFEAADSAYVDGRLTLGENIADLGGLTIAFQAYQNSMKGFEKPVIDGFTAEQRFFISFAQVWKSNTTEDFIRDMVKTNVHAPAKFRVLGTLANMPEFYEAFGCGSGQAMYKEEKERAVIW